MQSPLVLELAVLGLATWRLTRLLLYERGPYGWFTKAREVVGVHHGEDGEPVSWPDTEWGRLVRCLDCGSVWVGAGLVGLYLLSPGFTILAALPFAVSAAAVIIGRWVDGSR